MTMPSNRICALIMLMALAAVGGSVSAYAEDKDKEQMVVVDPQTLKFAEIPDMPACATAGILRGNPRNGAYWALLKLASGCEVPWHWHTANETLVVISGRGIVSMKDGPPLKLAPGAYTSLPSHHLHKTSCSRTCLFFNGGDEAYDIHYVDEKGEEVSAKNALKPSAKATKKK